MLIGGIKMVNPQAIIKADITRYETAVSEIIIVRANSFIKHLFVSLAP